MLLVLCLNQPFCAAQSYYSDDDDEVAYEENYYTEETTILPAAAPPLATSPFPAARQQEIITDLDYNPKPAWEQKERERREKAAKKAKESQEKSWWDRWNSSRDIGPLEIPAWLFYSLLALFLGLCGYVIYQLLDGRFGRTPKEQKSDDRRVELEEIEEERISFRETESLLERAVRNEQYELAVRLQYLSLLKRLHEMKLIVFKKNKVNRAYLFEMDRQALGKAFRKITLDYERNWYGNYPTDRLSYRLVASRFEQLQQQLDQIEQPTYE